MNIKIFGKDYAVTFNMAVQIEFEEISGLPFDIGDKDRPGTLRTYKASLQLYYASLRVANKNLPFTFDQLTGADEYEGHNGISPDEYSELTNAVMGAMFAWYRIPKVMQTTETQQMTEDDQKNSQQPTTPIP